MTLEQQCRIRVYYSIVHLRKEDISIGWISFEESSVLEVRLMNVRSISAE